MSVRPETPWPATRQPTRALNRPDATSPCEAEREDATLDLEPREWARAGRMVACLQWDCGGRGWALRGVWTFH